MDGKRIFGMYEEMCSFSIVSGSNCSSLIFFFHFVQVVSFLENFQGPS